MNERQTSASINQIPSRLAEMPDFRNLGEILRCLLLTNAFALCCALIATDTWTELGINSIAAIARVEPPLILMIILWIILRPLLLRWRKLGILTFFFCAEASALIFSKRPGLALELPYGLWLWAAAAAALVLLESDYRQARLFPAFAEARLQALTHRIRPHFLFNSLNAVLGIIREQPRQAEKTLEEIAEVIRVLMHDTRKLVSLGREIAITERYLNIEKLRLGERLQVSWQLGDYPRDALVPPLMLQPLVENAIYHGVELMDNGGEIRISVRREAGNIVFEVSNPRQQGRVGVQGNGMALDNIRERLRLFYDLDARLESNLSPNACRVIISLPYRVNT